MKRFFSVICAAALLLSLVSCSSDSSTTDTAETAVDYSNTELIGEITAIDGTTLTLTLGELTEVDFSAAGEGGFSEGEAGSMPEGDSVDVSGDADTMPEGEAPSGDVPEMDETSGSEDAPVMDEAAGSADIDFDSADGEGETAEGGAPAASDSETMELPDDADQSDAAEDGTMEIPTDGEMDGEAGQEAMGSGGMTMYTFTAGEETATIDIGDAEILSDTDSSETLDSSALSTGDVVVIVVGDDNDVTSVTIKSIAGENSGEVSEAADADMQGGDDSSSFGDSSEVTQGTAATEITEDGTYTDTAYASTGDDENALRITGATVTLDGITVSKSDGSSSDTESGDFYGMNAALLATDGATVTITNATITSSAQNGNGVFSYGSGTTVTISDSVITTTADNSGGIQTTGGGTTIASNLTVTTSGSSSAAIRSDRGGGTVTVTGGTYTTNGYNSPAVYSTATITVSDAVLTANDSEALVIEGQNSITLVDCDVSGNMSDTQGTSSDINVHSVMIYQSQSGDAEVGTSAFSMTGGSLTSNNGDVIFVTNTSCTIYLSDVEIINNETDGNLLTISGNDASHGWGSAGSNGAQVVMTADAQTLEGDITVDTISTLDLTLTNGSTLTGTINIVDNAEGGTAVSDNAVITIESGCTWTLTGDCTITSLTNNGTINYNGYSITLADGTVLSE